jgi:hypothetical protein
VYEEIEAWLNSPVPTSTDQPQKDSFWAEVMKLSKEGHPSASGLFVEGGNLGPTIIFSTPNSAVPKNPAFTRDSDREEYLEELMPAQEKKSPTFDPEALQAEAKQMLKAGTMPSKEQLEAALERIRKEYGPKILKAREQDQQENSSETSRSNPSASRRPEDE